MSTISNSAVPVLAVSPLQSAAIELLSRPGLMAGICAALAGMPVSSQAADPAGADILALRVESAQMHSSALPPQLAQAPLFREEAAPVPSSDTSAGAVFSPPPIAVSAADRLREDPVQQAPVAVPQPPPPVKLSRDERVIASYIARSYRVANESIDRFVHYAFKAAGEFRLDPNLVLAVMAVESSFDPEAQSSAGAQGLMQVLTRVHTDRFEPFGGPQAAWDPLANIKVGASILSEYVKRYGDVAAGLKAYVGAALLDSDGGYGHKVMSRQAEFQSVVGPGPAAKVRARANDPAPPAKTVSIAGNEATSGSSTGL